MVFLPLSTFVLRNIPFFEGIFDCNSYVWLFITAYAGVDFVAVLPVLKKT